MNLSAEQERELTYACQKAASYWDVKSQLIALLEEMGELQVLIAKLANGKQGRVEDFESKVVDEMADVHFLLSQMELIFGNSEKVRERLLFKCARTIEFIEKSKL
jgi:NTP pyrophosphatase (non-canonical NTP hydrolase)